MTSAPPPDSHPTGPPSGPLSGPSSGPVSEPTRTGGPPTEVDRPRGPGGGPGGGGGGGGGGGAGGPGGGVPWWRSAPRVAIVAAAVVAAVVVIVVLTRPGGGAGEVVLQPAAADGRDPFTRSTAAESSPPPSPSASPGTPSGATTGVPSYRGSEPGLYGGSRDATSCDVEQQISFLEADRAKALAFAGAQGIDVGAVPSFLRSLTPVQLRKDTRVTNHGFRDGKATAFQSVLQAGTAVLIDSRGLPRVRCACGNPLAEPEPLSSEAKTSGTSWPGYRAANTVAVSPATTEMRSFVLYDAQTNQYFDRPRGTDGGSDTWAPPPGTSTGSPSPTQSPGSETPSTPSTSASSPSTPETTGTTTAPETPTTTTVPPAPSGGESAPSS